MKKTILLLAVCIAAAGASHAQTQKGTLLLGGNLYVNQYNNESVTAHVQIGGFIQNDLAIGAVVDYIEDFYFSAFARKYFGQSEKGKFFLQAQLGSEGEFAYGATAGYAVFIRPTIAVEFSGTYKHAGEGYFLPAVGFQIHLPKK